MQLSTKQRVARRVFGIAVLAGVALPAWAGPADPGASRPGSGQPASQTAPPATAGPATSSLGLDFGPAEDLGKLELSRGGTDTKNDMKLDGVVTGNSAINVSSGANLIDSGSFSNMTGIPVVIQNSGANVLIQSATIINVQFR